LKKPIAPQIIEDAPEAEDLIAFSYLSENILL